MKKKEMKQILDTNIDDYDDKEKENHIKNCIKIKNFNLRVVVAALTVPFVVGTMAGSIMEYKDGDHIPFIRENQNINYYYNCKQDDNGMVILDENSLSPNKDTIIIKRDWVEQENGKYIRNIEHYSSDMDITINNASKIIESGHENIGSYTNKLLFTEKEISYDNKYIKQNQPSIALEYSDINKTENKKEEIIGNIIDSLMPTSIGLLVSGFGCIFSTGYQDLYQKSKIKLKSLKK